VHRLLLLLALLLPGCPAPADDDDATEPETPEPPCARWNAGEPQGTVEDEALDEISGLVASRQTPGALWVHEDSGAGPVLFALNASGRTVAELTLEGAPSADWEDLALGACAGDEPTPTDGGPWCIVVADFGDNFESRDDIALLRFEEPEVDLGAEEPDELTADFEEIRTTYPEGPQNAEALVLEADGTPVVITKRTDGDAWLYRMPRAADDTTEPVRIATTTIGPVGGLIDTVTGADLTTDGTRLLLRTYAAGWLYDLGDDGLDGIHEDMQREVLVAPEPQGEAIAWSAFERDILHVSEAVAPPINRLSCRD